MPRKGETRAKPPVGDARDPDSLYHHMLRFSAVAAGEELLASARSRTARRRCARSSPGAHERGLTRPQEITKPILERYPAPPVPLPQARRRAALDAQPARPHDADQGVLQVALAAATTSSTTRPRSWSCRAWNGGCPGTSSTCARSRRCSAMPDLATADRHPRPRHPGDALLDRHPAHGADPPALYRHRRRARHADGPPGQGQEGPHDPDRRRGRSPGSTNTATTCGPTCRAATDDGTLFLTTLGRGVRAQPADPARARLCRRGRHRQARLVPPVPPHHGDADAGERRRHPLHPGDARPRRAIDHADLHPGQHPHAQADPHRHPSRSTDRARGSTGTTTPATSMTFS